MASVKVASAQYPISFFSSWLDWQKHMDRWIEAAVAEQAELLVFPEYGAIELTSLFGENDRQDLTYLARGLSVYIEEFKKYFRKQAVQNNIYILAPSIPVIDHERVVNRAFVFSSDGKVDYQDKHFMTRFEDEDWKVQSGEPIIKIFKTKSFSFSVSICFDVEFPGPAQIAARNGAQILLAPSCTETLKGLHRVHIGARARALENQFFVVVAQTILDSKWSPAVDINTGQAAVYGPPDLGFTDDGVLAQGLINSEGWVYQDLNLDLVAEVRTQGAVFNYHYNQSENYSKFNHQVIDF